MAGPSPPQTILIVGAGELGATAALALAEGPYKGQAHLITVVERGHGGETAQDAAISDYNKIVRADYSDPVYNRLSLEAIQEWRSPRWAPFYHECGVTCHSSTSHDQIRYVRTSHELNEKSKTAKVSKLEKGKNVKGLYPKGIPTGEFEGSEAYFNHVGGWAATRDCILNIIDLARQLGVKFVQGEAESLIVSNDVAGAKPKMRGVRLVDGSSMKADVTLLCAGAWTPKLLPELATSCLPTGQTVLTILLNKEEMKQYIDMPVSLFMDTGFYCFPPTANGTLKMAIHDRGWLAASGSLPSLPRTKLSPGHENQEIPASALTAIRAGLTRVHPELVSLLDGRIGETRMCWYSDRETGDFLIDYHPDYDGSLFVAAGGSGHCAKFAPLTGSWIVDRLQDKLDPELTCFWAFHGDCNRLDKSRGEGLIVRRDLDTGKVAMLKTPDKEIERIKAKL